MTKIVFVSVVMLMILAACGEEPAEEIQLTATEIVVIPTDSPDTPTPRGDQKQSDPPTITPVPTETTIAATSTPVQITPTPTVPAAQHMDVDLAPYAVSECSDKYPCNDDLKGWEERLRVAPGFEISYFARIDDYPTSITIGPDGRLYVASWSGKIYAIDESANIEEYFDGFKVPTGIAFGPDGKSLYVSNRVTDTNVNGEGQISVIEDGEATTLIDGLPCCYIGMHGPNGIAFGPDGFGYVGVGGRADHGERLAEPGLGEQDELHPYEAAILRFSPDGKDVEVFAYGFRNPYDIVWDSQGNLYATDNGRDPDLETLESPPDEVHLVVPNGEHGYPYYDCSTCFGVPDGMEIIAPILDLIPHAAVTGVTAYQSDLHPEFVDDLFIALWSAFEGAQKVVRFSPDTGESSDFASGFAQPIDITVTADGKLFVADYATGIIFEISPES